MGQVAPVINQVSYRGTQITVRWSDDSSGVTITGYVVTLWQNDGTSSTQWGNYPQQQLALSLTFTPWPAYPFNPACSYQAQVFGYSSENPNGLGSNLITVANVIQQPTITAVSVDADNAVTFTWKDPTPAPIPNYYLANFSWTSGGVNVSRVFVTSNELTETSWTFEQAPPVGIMGTYSMTLSGSYSASTQPGPASDAVNVLYQQLSPTQVYYNGGAAVGVSWPSPTEPGSTGVSLSLTSMGIEVASASVATGTNETTISAPGALAPGQPYQVTVQVTGASTGGPLGPAIPVLVASPTLQAIGYDEGVLALSWAPALQSAVLGYEVVTTYDGVTKNTFFTNGTTLALPVVLDDSDLNGVVVAPVGYNCIGPSVAAAPPTTPMQITSIAYNATAVTAAWTVSGQVPAGAAYELSLFDGGAFVGSTVTGNSATGGTLTLALVGGHDYTARARVIVTGGIPNVGPWSNEVPVLAVAPTLLATAYDGVHCTAVWSSTLEPGVTAYKVTMTSSLGTFTQQVVGTQYDVALDLSPTYVFSLTVQSVGAAQSAGPVSPPRQIVSNAPELTAVTYAGGTVTATWSVGIQPTNALYELAIFDGDGLVSSGVAGNTASSGSLAIALTAGRSYTARGRIVLGISLGPWSGAVAVLVGIPAIALASWENDQLALGWTRVTEPGVLGYQVVVSDGTSTVASVTVSGTSLALTLVPDSMLAYSVAVTTIGAATVGPAPAAATSLLSITPSLTSIAYASGAIAVEWSIAATAPTGAGYCLELYDGGGLVQLASGDWDTSASMPVTLATGHDYSVRVRMVNSIATIFGPWSGLGAVLVAAPTISVIAYADDELELAWTAVEEPGARAYSVAVMLDGKPIASAAVAGTATSFPLALVPGGYSVVICSVAGALGQGPVSTADFTVPAQPVVSSLSYSSDGALAVYWNAVTGADGYLVELLINHVRTTSIAVASTTTAATLYAVLAADAIADVRVTARAGNVNGPPSVPARVVPAAPLLTHVYYDGTNVYATWTPVALPGAGAITYAIAVVQGQTVVASTTSTTTSAKLAASLTGTGYLVQVGATIAGNSAGPASAGVNPQVGATEIFFSPTATTAPYIYRSSLRPPLPSSLTGAPVTLYFPNLFNGAMPTNPPSGNAFTLAPVSNGGVISYSISVAAASAWTFTSAPIRASLRSDYLAFMQWMEPSMCPGAATLVQRALALALPLTFAETLLYRYGFNPAAGYCDLAPGMRLRLDAESYQPVPGASPADLDGFVGASSAEYELMAAPVANNVVNVAFDSFLSLLGSTTVENSRGGMGGVIDLYGPGGNKPYYRLFYPASFPPANGQGHSDPSRNVALVGARSIAALEAATTKYLAQRNFNGVASSAVSVFYFRGRLVALPRVVVFVDGEPTEISIGTSLRQLLGPVCSLPFQEALPVTSISVARWMGGVIDQAAQVATSLDVALSNAFNFADQTITTYGGTTDWFDVPLFGGDRVLVGGRA